MLPEICADDRRLRNRPKPLLPVIAALRTTIAVPTNPKTPALLLTAVPFPLIVFTPEKVLKDPEVSPIRILAFRAKTPWLALFLMLLAPMISAVAFTMKIPNRPVGAFGSVPFPMMSLAPMKAVPPMVTWTPLLLLLLILFGPARLALSTPILPLPPSVTMTPSRPLLLIELLMTVALADSMATPSRAFPSRVQLFTVPLEPWKKTTPVRPDCTTQLRTISRLAPSPWMPFRPPVTVSPSMVTRLPLMVMTLGPFGSGGPPLTAPPVTGSA